MDNNKEIDLIELFIKMLLYVKKYKWILISALVLSLVFSFVKINKQIDIYTSSMLLKVKGKSSHNYTIVIKSENFEYINKQESGELVTKIINTAEVLRVNNNIEKLVKRMDFDKAKIQTIVSINADNNFDNKPISNFVTITVLSKKKDVYVGLEKAFMNFISSNELIKAKYKRDSIFLTNVISEIDLKQGSGDIHSGMEDFLLKEKLKLNLKELKIVELVEGFYYPNANSKNSKLIFTLNAFVFLFFASVIIVVLILNETLKKYSHKK